MAIQFNPNADGVLEFTNSDGTVVFTVTEAGGVVLPTVVSAPATGVEGQVLVLQGVGLVVYTSGAWV